MRVKLLGSAAGGGFPQWNCGCPNCRSLRDGTFRGKARTHLEVAISQDNRSWFLLNASPDIRQQIEAHPDLYASGEVRGTPVRGVILTSGDLDQILGLLMMREFQQFRIYATRSIQHILREDNSMFAVLNRVPEQVEWIEITPGRNFRLSAKDGTANLCCTPVSLESHFPAYVAEQQRHNLASSEMLMGLLLRGASGRRLAYFPAVPKIDRPLLDYLENSEVVLFDGTFWSDTELRHVRGSGPTAREIGHVPISGADGSLRGLSRLSVARKIYVHINNTNPILDESSAEYRQVREAGWEIAEDQWELEL